MFWPCQASVKTFLKRIYKFNLQEIVSHFLHNVAPTSAVFLCTFSKFLTGWEDKKIKCIRLLKLEAAGVSEVYR